jgi:hypothetical protein
LATESDADTVQTQIGDKTEASELNDYAYSDTSVRYTDAANRPTMISFFTNDEGYVTDIGSQELAHAANTSLALLRQAMSQLGKLECMDSITDTNTLAALNHNGEHFENLAESWNNKLSFWYDTDHMTMSDNGMKNLNSGQSETADS